LLFSYNSHRENKILYLLLISGVNRVVAELEALLVGGNNTDVVTERLLLKVLLGEVLKVALAHGDGGGDGNLGASGLSLDLDEVTENTSLAAVDLDAVLEELDL